MSLTNTRVKETVFTKLLVASSSVETIAFFLFAGPVSPIEAKITSSVTKTPGGPFCATGLMFVVSDPLRKKKAMRKVQGVSRGFFSKYHFFQPIFIRMT